jgi:hypothetical protein
MSRISIDALLLKRRVNILKYTPSILVVIFLSLSIDGVLWYFCSQAASQSRSAWIAAGSAWGLAVVGYVSKWLDTITDQVKESRENRRAAYKTFLSESDRLVEARVRLADCQSAYDNAQDKLVAAKRQYELSPTDQNKKAVITADANLEMFSGSLQNASNNAANLLDAYQGASNDVDQLVSSSARPALDAFKQFPPRDTTDRRDARSRFIKAARHDVKLPQRADESTL